MSGSARSSQGYWDHLAEILIIFSFDFFFKYDYVRFAVGRSNIRKFCEVNVPIFFIENI